jgi:hypothetical protein
MPEMTNLMDALVSLQAALDAGTVQMRECDIHPDLKVLLDHPAGEIRLTYARIVAGIVQAITIFVPAEPVGHIPCFSLGYAVIESMRGRGLAKETVMKAMDEMLKGLKRNGIRKFYVEAIVATSNVASNRLARRLLSDSPSDGTDAISGDPIFQYLKLFKCGD